MASKDRVTGPNTRDDPPVPADWGMVVRPIGPGASGAILVEEVPSTNSTVTAIAVSAAPVLALAPSATRLGWSIRNTSDTDTMFVLASPAGVVSSTFHTVALRPHGYYEDPYHYTGRVEIVWDNATSGEALITDYEP